MKLREIAKVRAIVGHEPISILVDMFRRTQSDPLRTIPIARYRADHQQWLDALDKLEQDQLFIKRVEPSQTSYRLRVYSLPLLNLPKPRKLLRLMDDIYIYFRGIYQSRLTEPLKVDEIVEAYRSRKIGKNLLREALYYMADGHGVWCGLSNGFPYAKDSYICIAETVLRHENFTSLIHQAYAWHILNPKRQLESPVLVPAEAKAAVQRKRSRRRKRGKGFLGGRIGSSREWYESLRDDQKALIRELDKSMDIGLAALPTMGLRSLVEQVVLHHIPDKGNFKANIEAFEAAGYITKQHAALLTSVVDVGHAAIHRSHFPSRADLTICVDAVKHLIHGVYILKPRLDAVSEKTPKRKPPAPGATQK